MTFVLLRHHIFLLAALFSSSGRHACSLYVRLSPFRSSTPFGFWSYLLVCLFVSCCCTRLSMSPHIFLSDRANLLRLRFAITLSPRELKMSCSARELAPRTFLLVRVRWELTVPGHPNMHHTTLLRLQARHPRQINRILDQNLIMSAADASTFNLTLFSVL